MEGERFSNLDKAKENAQAFAEEVLGYVPNRAVARPAIRQPAELRSAA